jgi:hypothetical protein
MNKLSKENIQFIENYLDNSDVFYADIRMEMVDHVASEIEAQINLGDTRDFYFIFKEYMINNKARLLKNYKQFANNSLISAFKKIIKQLFTFSSLIIFTFSYWSITHLIGFVGLDQLYNFIIGFPVLSIVPFCIVYVLLLKVYKLPRFSGIEHLSYLYMMCFQLFNLSAIFLKEPVERGEHIVIMALWMSVITTISIVLILITFFTVKKYSKEYKFN